MTEVPTRPADLDWSNPFANKEDVTLQEYFDVFKSRIIQESERLFISDFLFPILGSKNIKYVIPQYPFIDSEGRSRRIDFGIVFNNKRIALEVNGETYHAEGIIPNDMFDDNLNRQNEILNAGWYLLRFSYSQLQSPEWRPRVSNAIFYLLRKKLPELISERIIEPNPLQKTVLGALDYYRGRGWKKGIVILPTGTGKTFLSAFDSTKVNGRILFIVHKLDILMQSREAFEKIYPNEKLGLLTGEVKEYVHNSKVLFASKDSLRNTELLASLSPTEFDYIIIDEVHHGQAPTYQTVIQHFQPNYFMLGLTATPDRMDRKDIFELFDYQKIYEYTLNEAIEDGFLVPYTYYGLRDNIDYSEIRHNGAKYNVADLDRTLIIKERNEKIYEEYLQKGLGHKALGFCCSIKHAEAMASFFNSKGIPSCAITSESTDREELVKGFRNNKYSISFTVDLFNEGVDFPDLRVLLFLRPTESKTVFFQQLGRGLRLCGGKEKAIVIDFIGNYKKANNIRKYLSKGSTPKVNKSTGRVEKIEYEYSPGCEVLFESEVEEILDRQDTIERDITKEDLVDAYYKLAEKINKKPAQEDINHEGEFPVSKYLIRFGTWVNFLREIGELTEFSYHFPQGTHLGHVLYIINTVGSNTVKGSHISPEYVRFSGGYDKDDIAKFQRQTKYKLQACMELGLLVDYRKEAMSDDFSISLTNDGLEVYYSLKPFLDSIDFSFDSEGKTEISWSMKCESTINLTLRKYIDSNQKTKKILRSVFLKMDAVNLFLKYLYIIQRIKTIKKAAIYADFFNAPFVMDYLDRHGLDIPTEEVIRRRVPFLINILDSLGIINQSSSEIEIQTFVTSKEVLRINSKEHDDIVNDRIQRLLKFSSVMTRVPTESKIEIAAEDGKTYSLKNDPREYLSSEEISFLKESFGKEFLTEKYHLKIEDI